MIEKSILLDISDLNKFYGIRDSNIELVRRYFPKIKIINRGDTIKIIGEEQDIIEFELYLNKLISHFNKFNTICPNDIKLLYSDPDKIIFDGDNDALLYSVSGKPIKGRTKNQNKIIAASKINDLVISLGPAGTGKTFLAIALAVKALKEQSVKRIILSRPAVEAGEKLGFLPGDVREKLDPYLQPLYDALQEMIPSKKLEKYLEERIIQIAPLAYMRGRTLNDAFVILDEGQNTTYGQLKMFLTRMGVNSKFIVTGDLSQVDLPPKAKSGLLTAKEILSDIKGISIIELNKEDIVRHKLVNKIVEAYENKLNLNKNENESSNKN